MKCKAGDLAVIIKPSPQVGGIVGKIVKCLELVGDDHWRIEQPFKARSLVHCTATSYIDGRNYSFKPGDAMTIKSVSDQHLMPIRDQPGADESLSWAPVPTTKTLTEEEFKSAEVKWGEKV